MTCTLTTSPIRPAAAAPASVAALTAATSPVTNAVTNPLPITSGRDEEDADSIRIDAPEAFRALPLRAVRPQDYRDIIERLDDIQRGVAPDPHGWVHKVF